MFIGREKELAALNKLYASDKFEFAVIYGRRRVGKTALINQFIKDKKAVYFTGVESNALQNLENLSKSILEYSAGIRAETAFLSFQAALEYVFQLSERERLILVLDEYPYAARSFASLASTLQLLIDLMKPKLNWENEQQAVKQNYMVVVDMFLGAGLTAGIGFLVFKAYGWLSLPLIAYAALVCVLLAVLSAAVYLFVMACGVRRMNGLEA